MDFSKLKLGKTSPPIGVDVGRQGVRLVQFDQPGPQGRVIASARQPLPAGVSPKDQGYHPWVTTAVKTALDRGDFTGRHCVSALPSGSVEVKSLRLPRMPGDEQRDAVAWEMRDRFKPEKGELSVQYMVAGEVRQGEDVRDEIIALAADTAFIEQHVGSLAEAGLAPLAVEVSVAALARAFAQETEQGVHTIVDIGYESSKILIVRDGRVVFFKILEIAGRTFDQSVADQVSMPLGEAKELRRQFEVNHGDERFEGAHRALREALRTPVSELGREIDLCLRYFGVTFHGARPEALTLVGGESLQPWLAPMLAEQNGLAVEVGDPTHGAIEIENAGAGWAVAVGLAGRPERGWGERRRRERKAA